ncbi:hypothetical protein FHJ31_25365 [Pseudomonas sp. Fig-3]|nr:hypothetical protein FHJ31_25365 [Pseudomonas sp. Fig-3]
MSSKKFVFTEDPVWERACSRWRHHIQHRCKLTHRYREQARSHRGISVEHKICVHRRSSVGASLLAMASSHSPSMQTDPPLSRASSLPQGWGDA